MKHLFSVLSVLGLIGLSQIAAKVSASEIAVTIKPLHSLVTAVGNTAKPYLLVSETLHPMDLHLSLLVGRAQQGKNIFVFDEDFETFMEKALNSLSESVKRSALQRVVG